MTDTKTVKIGDAEFTLRVIDRRLWNALMQKTAAASKSWKSQLKKLTASDLSKSKEEISKILLDGIDPEELAKSNELLYLAQWEVIRNGVVAHAGIKKPSGEEIPAVKTEAGVLHDDTVNLYDLREYFIRLYSEIVAFNTTSEEERKN